MSGSSPGTRSTFETVLDLAIFGVLAWMMLSAVADDNWPVATFWLLVIGLKELLGRLGGQA